MGMEKNMNARIQHKHDIEANWNKAINFIPKAGEIIIYDIDENYNYSRFKIGDGVRTINDLEFLLDTQYILHDSNTLSQLLEQYNDILTTKQPVGDYALKSEIPTDYLTEIPSEYVTETELNAKGYLTSYTETDPTVPAWAKASVKPTYTASEVGAYSKTEIDDMVFITVDDIDAICVKIIEFSISNIYGEITKYQAKDGMTWVEWIVSDYNTTGLTAEEMTIRYINHNEVETTSAIQEGVLYEEIPIKRAAGLYKAGTNFGELLCTWDELIENDMVWVYDGRFNISVDSNEYESVDLIISDTVTTLGCQCFDNATSLENVVVPSSVTHMEDSIFWGIKTVILQAINPTMGCNTFGDGYNVITTDIYYAGSEAQWNAIQVECYCISPMGDGCEYDGLYIPENATIHYNYTE